jgi:two-component system, NarL family, nitrate/nitrite response regulator NarL
VRAAAAGLVSLPREMLADVLAAGVTFAPLGAGSLGTSTDAPRVPSGTTAALTPREREVLTLLGEGLANKAIAPRLGITEHTVKAHVAAIYAKLGAGNRAEAVMAAARAGLLLL